MDARPKRLHPRRSAAYRSACLAVGALCLLAALAGTVGRSGTTVHHRTHALAATALGHDVQGGTHRTGLDAVPAEHATARTSTARPATTPGAPAGALGQAPGAVRTRGPPVPA